MSSTGFDMINFLQILIGDSNIILDESKVFINKKFREYKLIGLLKTLLFSFEKFTEEKCHRGYQIANNYNNFKISI